MTSPTQRSKAFLQEQGFTVAIVEHWNSHVRIRQDMFGVFDLVAIRPGGPIAAVQTTTAAGGAAKRLAKILATEAAKTWLEAGGTISIHSWSKRNNRKAGTRKLWSCLERNVTLRDFQEASGASTAAQDRSWPVAASRETHLECDRVWPVVERIVPYSPIEPPA